MGSGGVAIAALPTVICLKVPFSDGLGGEIFVIYENPSFRHDKATEAKGTKPFFKQSDKY